MNRGGLVPGSGIDKMHGGDEQNYRRASWGSSYLWVLQASEVGVQVELDALAGARQRHAADQQHDEHDERERGCDVDHLRKRRTVRTPQVGFTVL